MAPGMGGSWLVLAQQSLGAGQLARCCLNSPVCLEFIVSVVGRGWLLSLPLPPLLKTKPRSLSFASL